MDKTVQQSASNAQESAAASEEMNAQAQQMKNFVRILSTLVAGSSNGFGHKNSAESVRKKLTGLVHGDKKVLQVLPKVASEKTDKAHKVRIVKPNEMITMQEGQFKDF